VGNQTPALPSPSEPQPRDPLSLHLLALGHLLFECLQQAGPDPFREGLRFDTLVKLYRHPNRVDDSETLLAVADVRLDPALQLHVDLRVQIVVQFLKKLPTGKQERLPFRLI